ncbi:MAG TPA: ClpX C4-type zinc finger protein [Thermoanaerobaculia bacterium]|nr:ClpX C4-type zinc finger protein [Thermoanaerobaculia bacterium]
MSKPSRNTKTGSSGDVLRCSFCNKSQRDVKKLIAGPTVYICDECVEICVEILAEDGIPLHKLIETPVPEALVEAAEQVTPGYDEPKRLIAAALIQHAVRVAENDRQAGLAPVFIVGGAGAGKSLLVKAMVMKAGLAMAVVEVPLLFTDALFKPQIDFTDFVQKPGVIILNHIEAVAMRGNRAEECRRVQQSLISLIDGSLLPVANEARHGRTNFDTARTLFIALAALPELQHADAESLAMQGYLPELVSRFGTFIALPPLNEEHLARLLTREGGLVTACTERFMKYGMRVKIEDSAVQELVQLGIRRKAGVRGLKALVDRLGIALACEQIPAGQELCVDSAYVRRNLQ